ncbi:hypothetical protein EJ04DRAFT_480599 [Polyplosphaeria fusca]|uniref:Uncharacterized protein n=1 Tax=Polyplosphaeria fusca TaxID=682080 RepID=A0A9P4RCY3_9PLEO|nr:hypothetical protein EJ04DRAFT_480599 [Polyplosphaeria fusca]
MGVANPPADPANVIQALVYTLLDVFDATRDLYNTLRNKERRDYEQSLRSRGYPESRRIDIVDDDKIANDESIVFDKAAVTREFEIGYQDVGNYFAVGDVVSQTALQSQIITLQSVLITTFLYGPGSPEPISHHLSSVLAASRAAGTSSVDILAAQHQRQRALLPPASRSRRLSGSRSAAPVPALPYPVTEAATTSGASTALVKSTRDRSIPRSSGPAKTTILDVGSRPKALRTDTESTSFSGLTSFDNSFDNSSVPGGLYCPYAVDLQRHPDQPLHSTLMSSDEPYCSHCRRILNLSPGKSWEVYKEDEGTRRLFHIQNRFVVKCHRESADGGYCCILCTRAATIDTVCGDVKALVRHVWMDHGVGEFELEEDIQEVADKPTGRRRRDSVISNRPESRRQDSRRSVSLGPGRRNDRRFSREVETYEAWNPSGRSR